jgi:hypothetical protein
MNQSSDEGLAAEFSARRAEAEAFLWQEMHKLGLRKEDGWKISESMRDGSGGSELVMRPIHRTRTAPDGLECVVRIVEDTKTIDSECSPPSDEA